LGHLANVAGWQDDVATALACHEEAVAILRTAGGGGLLRALNHWGLMLCVAGEAAQAEAILLEGLASALENGRTVDIGAALSGLGSVAALRGQFAVAARFWGGAAVLEERSPHWVAEAWNNAYLRSHTAARTTARTALGAEAFAAAWNEGRTVSPERLLAEARALAADRVRTPAGHVPTPASLRPDGLTPREVEVLRLVAAGKTNREIAALLFVSPNTIGFHVKGIFNKTGVANRAEAASYAHQHQLIAPSP
jgi:DNA-binding CsgD family transcriptional regulator